MVCIAAFIILALVGIIVAFLSIFNRELGKKYWKLFKKAFHCFGKRVRLQKCDTNFSDDIKTALLKKVIIKKPKLVKPLSITIEIASVLVVLVTVWSIIEAAKAGLSLWVFGTCNVSQPSSCALGADSCGIDEDNLNWFTEWGEIFENIPDRLKTWNVSEFFNKSDGLTPAFIVGQNGSEPGINAVEIIDPGCSICLQSYKNILTDENLKSTHEIAFVIYPIKNTDGNYRFKNSELITRYSLALNYYATEHYGETINSSSEENKDLLWQYNALYGYSAKIMNRLFSEFSPDGIIYQSVFNDQLSAEEAAALLDSWLTEWGLEKSALEEVKSLVSSSEIQTLLDSNIKFVEETIRPKGIPMFIYDGQKHLGLYK